jgi:hypothetical protein
LDSDWIYVGEVLLEVCSQISGLFEVTEGNREKKQKKKLDELDYCVTG